MGNAQKKLKNVDKFNVQYQISNSNIVLIGSQKEPNQQKQENTDILLMEKLIININKLQVGNQINIVDKFSYFKEEKQQQSKYELINSFKQMFASYQDVSIIYYSGLIDHQTGNMVLIENQQQMLLTLDEILDLWENRSTQQKLLLLLVDGNYSGLLVQQLKKHKKNKFVGIQASTSHIVIQNPENLRDPETNFSYFTEDLVTTLSLSNKTTLNLDKYKDIPYYNPSYYFYESHTVVFSLLGLPIFFQSVSDMHAVQGLGNSKNFSNKQIKFFNKEIPDALQKIKGGNKKQGENKIKQVLPQSLKMLQLYNSPNTPLYVFIDLVLLVNCIFPDTKPSTQLFDTNDIVCNKIGLVYYNEKVYQPCQVFFQKAQNLKPSNFTHSKNIVQTYSNLKQEENMLNAIQAIEQNPQFKQTQKNELIGLQANYWCIKYHDMNDLQKSIEQGEKAVECNPTSVPYFKNLMKSFVKLDMYDAAVAYYEGAKDRYKGQDQESIKGFVHNQIGVQLFQRQNYKEALIYFQVSYQQDPTNTVYCKNVIDSMKNLGEYQQAINFFNIIQPHFVTRPTDKKELEIKIALVHNLVGRDYYQDSKFQQAKNSFEKAFQLYPNEPTICKNLIKTNVHLKEYQNAIKVPENFKDNQIKRQELIDFAKKFIEDQKK